MKKLFIPAFVTALMVAFSGSALALNVGVAPPVIDFGTIEAGSRVSGSFYIASDSMSTFMTDLSSVRAPDDFYAPGRPRNGYRFNTSQASEEDVSSWVTFLENPVTTPPEKVFVSSINSWVNKKVDFVLDIPADAEPGYHAGQVMPSPRITPGATGGIGVGIVTMVKATYIFRIPDEARREAQVAGFDYARIDEDREEITVLVKNTGTVTESVKLESLEIYEGENSTLLEGSATKKIKPNEIVEFRMLLDVSDKELGSYRVGAKISWLTGEAEKAGRIEITEYVPPIPVTGGVIAPIMGPTLIGVPLWVYPVFIIFAAIVIYWWRYVRL